MGLPINFKDLPEVAVFALNRIRSETKVSLSQAEAEEDEILQSAIESAKCENLSGTPRLKPSQYRRIQKQIENHRLRARRNLFGEFLARYVGVLLTAGNDAAVLAGAMHGDVRDASLHELAALGFDLSGAIMVSALYEQEARCWGEAGRAQNLPTEPVDLRHSDMEVDFHNFFTTAAFRLNQLRASIRAKLARHEEERGEDRKALIADLQGEPNQFAHEILRDFARAEDQARDQIRHDLAAALVAEYVNILLRQGNHPASIARALEAELRKKCSAEAEALDVNQPETTWDIIFRTQASHCWALAQEAEAKRAITTSPTQITSQRNHITEPGLQTQMEAETTSETSMEHGTVVPLASPAAASSELNEARYYKCPDPLHFFGKWRLPDLSAASVSRLKIGIREIHRDSAARIDEGSEHEPNVRWCLRAYDVIASELWNEGRLSADLIKNEIPQMIFDASMTGYWFRRFPGSPLKTNASQIHFGNFWIDPDALDWHFLTNLQTAIALWLDRSDLPMEASKRTGDDATASVHVKSSAKGRLSTRDARIQNIVGEQNFRTLTNIEIWRDHEIKKRLRAQGVEHGDGMKSCLDRIRRAKDYPFSREITKNRSSTK